MLEVVKRRQRKDRDRGPSGQLPFLSFLANQARKEERKLGTGGGKTNASLKGKKAKRKRGRTILDFSDRRLCARLSSLLFS